MIGRNGMSQSRQVRARALGSSAMTVALMLAGPAFAQCAPDPTVSGTTTICNGTDSDGLVVSTRGTTVIVDQDATVSGANGEPGVDVRIQSASNGGPVALTVNGLVNDGIFLNVDPIAGDTNAHVLALTVGAGGQVDNGVAVRRLSFEQFGPASASIDNNGFIAAGSAEYAVTSFDASVPFTSIVNRTDGVIQGISGSVGTLDNSGFISGGQQGTGAVDLIGGSFASGAINNSGTIRSIDDGVATVNLYERTLNNSGVIDNQGMGPAIRAYRLNLNNSTTGSIYSGAEATIGVEDALQLANAGTIIGDVLAGSTSATTGSVVDSSAERIEGSLFFGSGNDTLIAAYDGTQLRYGVTGAIDGGAGTDTVRLRFATDATIATPLTLPTAFERFSLIAETGTTTTLAEGATGTEALAIGGGGTIVNNAVLTTLGQVIANDLSVTGTPGLTNNGTIALTTTRGTPYAIDLTRFSRFENNGTIDSARNAVSLGDATTGAVNNGVIVNNGTVNAYFTGMRVTGDSFTNSATGIIQSSNGIALALASGAAGTERSNAGLIDGQTGARLTSTSLVNSGTIQGTRTGVVLGGTATLDNRAGGVVSGPTAISGLLGGVYNSNNIVTNAGTINGDVVFANLADTVTTTTTRNRYFALPGGVLNGDLTLGRGDVLITDFVNTGTGAFAGINGQVNASRAALRLRVRADATTVLAERAGFTSIGYDLSNDAKLTVSGTSDQTLLVAGRGSVDLSGDINTVLRAAIQSISPTLAPGETAGTNALTITSSGDLELLRIEDGAFSGAVVMLQNGDRFTNSGTITITDRAEQNPNEVAAISGAAVGTGSGSASQVTNGGRISLNGAIGIRDTGTIVNTGTISQSTRNRTSIGVLGSSSYATTLTNSGTINVGGVAVQSDTRGMTIANSGRISSFGGLAIALGGFSTIDNAATGTIAGGLVEGQTERLAIRTAGGRLTNAGTITGTVDLGYAASGRSFSSGTYIQDGGTIDGNLLFGNGNDTLIAYTPLSINGTIDGGGGIDTLIQARRASDTVTLSLNGTTNFDQQGVRAIGADTVVTLRAIEPIAGSVALTGDGAIVNTATIESLTLGTSDQFVNGRFLFGAVTGSFTNQGTITNAIRGKTRNFTNTGTIAGSVSDFRTNGSVEVESNDTLTFVNTGRIDTDDVDLAGAFLSVRNGTVLTASNTGTINGYVSADFWTDYSPDPIAGSQSLSFTNTGTITSADTYDSPETLTLRADNLMTGGASITLDNQGLVESASAGGAAVVLRGASGAGAMAIAVTNSGTIRANVGEKIIEEEFNTGFNFIVPSVGVLVVNGGGTTQLTNTASGVIEATGSRSVAIAVDEGALDLTNAGIIRGGAGSRLADPENSTFGHDIESDYLAGAILTSIETDEEGRPSNADRIVNTGTIIGSIDLSKGNDRIENYGRIEGDVFLGAGDDTFLQRASATLIGTVDAGDGDDSFIVDATGGGTVNGDQFINFERFSQIGSGDVRYTGNFRLDTIDLSGGTISVASGQTLASDGAFTITGSDAVEMVVNDGTIAGGITLGGGNDRVVNGGTIGGAVLLGEGDDSFVDGPNGNVAGGIDGGAGTDSYNVVLAGDRTGVNAHSNFERLSVDGTGTLTFDLTQSFETTTLTGTGLNATLGGFSLGTVTGSDAAEQLMVDGDVASVALGAGNDMLSLGTQTAAGSYDGGAGSDTLAFTNAGPVTLTGTATGFEQLALTNGALTVAGTLGTVNAPLSFGDGAQSLTVASGGTLAGVIDLGAGNDALRLAGTLTGTVAGGAGSDTATLVMTGDRSLASTTLTGFETLASEGTGTLTLTGTHAYDAVDAGTSLTLVSGSTLTAPVRFGSGDQRFTIAGTFTGAVDGGAGSDTLAITGGTAANPVNFTVVRNIEALTMSDGFVTMSAYGWFGNVDIAGGRLVGLRGSILNGNVMVRSGATFGSAGLVNGNVTVAGTLSPGASPGRMDVSGNVSLMSGSLSLFEFTPTVQDQLNISGTLSIASGSTLQLTQSDGTLLPGTSYDLIVASGGISGSFTTIRKPDTLFGFVIQRADRIQLRGLFPTNAGFAPQVNRSITYANTVLQQQPATSPLFAMLPALTTDGGASIPERFARLTPEAYASATQIGVENALALTDIARGPGFAANRGDAGGFTFGQAIGSWYRLAADRSEGVSRAATNSYGFVGGIGYGDRAWSVGAFTGFVNSRQRIDALAARTGVDGWVAGVHGRYATGKLGFGASLAYHGGKADTDRALPASTASRASYDLTSVVGDLSAHYTIDMGEWALRPRAGVTYIRTSRDRAVETGGPFALTVAADRHVAGFADAGVGFARAETSDAAFRPFVSLGLRYQIEGQRTDAVAGYAGGPLGLVALGAGRARTVGTIAAGLTQRVTDGLDLFSTASAQTGSSDNRAAISTGVRLRF